MPPPSVGRNRAVGAAERAAKEGDEVSRAAQSRLAGVAGRSEVGQADACRQSTRARGWSALTTRSMTASTTVVNQVLVVLERRTQVYLSQNDCLLTRTNQPMLSWMVQWYQMSLPISVLGRASRESTRRRKSAGSTCAGGTSKPSSIGARRHGRASLLVR
jgi:hypothetical protein